MPEWLHDSFQRDADISAALLAIRLSAGLVLGCIVAGIYRLTHPRPFSQTDGMLATLVLLTVLIGVVTIVIGNSVARAFSLVGALGIVRFRTVVQDTRDTAFVIFAVAMGMAVGAGYFLVPLIGVPFVAIAALVFSPFTIRPGPAPARHHLRVRIGIGQDPDAVLRDVFSKYVESSHLTATASARQGAALDVTYGICLRQESMSVPLVAELNALAGVQEVELRQT